MSTCSPVNPPPSSTPESSHFKNEKKKQTASARSVQSSQAGTSEHRPPPALPGESSVLKEGEGSGPSLDSLRLSAIVPITTLSIQI